MEADAAVLPTYGTIVFDDGSTYTGTLRAGQPDGLGTCKWKDGNEYDGEWKSGVMHGFGTYRWATGESYYGEWKEGRRDGIGVKKYADGSTFEGTWKDGRKHGVGVFRQAQSGKKGITRTASGRFLPQHLAQISGDEKVAEKAVDKAADNFARTSEPKLSPSRSSPALRPSPFGAIEAATVVATLPEEAIAKASSLGAVLPSPTNAVGLPRLSAPQVDLGSKPGSGRVDSGSLFSMVPQPAGSIVSSTGQPAIGFTVSVNEDMPDQDTPKLHHPHMHAPHIAPSEAPTVTSEPDLTGASPPATAVTFGTSVHDATGMKRPPSLERPSHTNLQVAPGSIELVMLGAGDRVTSQQPESVVASTPGGSHKDVVFIRRFEEGRLVHEDKLTKGDMRAIFKGVFKAPKVKDDSKGKRVKRRLQRVIGRGKKLQHKAGQQLYKGMPGYDLMLRLQLGIRQSIGHMAKPTVRAPHNEHPPPEAAVSPTAQNPNQTQDITVVTPNVQRIGADGKLDPVNVVTHVTQTASGQVTPRGSVVGASNPATPNPAVKSAVAVKTNTGIMLNEADFTFKSKVFFPAAGSNITPAHPSTDFKWKDYSPKVFQALRRLWGVEDDAEYMLSLAGSESLRQLSSPGKSGCMFFLSEDQKYLVKTMRKSEIHTLIGMLPQYYEHMVNNRDSLVPRFYGVYGVKQLHGRTVRFVVMLNIFNTDLQMHRRFDLKGSTFERSAGPMDPLDTKTVWKDLDLDMSIQLPKEVHERLQKQLAADVDLLDRVGVMDYSLLLGIHFCARGRQQQPLNSNKPEAAAAVPPVTTTASGTLPPMLKDPQMSLANTYRHLSNDHDTDRPGAALPTPINTDDVPTGQETTVVSGVSPRGMSFGSPFERSHPPAELLTDTQHRNSYANGGPHPIFELQGAGQSSVTHERQPVNFDLYTSQDEQQAVMAAIASRMRALNYSEDRIKDVLGLAKLKILGDKLGDNMKKKKRRGKYKQSRAVNAVRAREQARTIPTAQGDSDTAQANQAGGDTSPRAGGLEVEHGLSSYVPGMAPHLNHLVADSGDTDGDKNATDKAAGDSSDSSDDLAGDSPRLMGTASMLRNHVKSLYPSPTMIVQPTAAMFSKMPLGHIMPARVVYRPSLAASLNSNSNSSAHASRMLCGIPCVGLPHTTSLERVSSEEHMVDGKVPEHGAQQPAPKANDTSNDTAQATSVDEGAVNRPKGLLPLNIVPQPEDADAEKGEEVWICFGIIDILQDWNTRKAVERGWKATFHDGYAISVAPPDLYAQRFLEFMKTQVFPAAMPQALTNMAAWHTGATEYMLLGPPTRAHSTRAILPGTEVWWGSETNQAQLYSNQSKVVPAHTTILEDDGDEADAEDEAIAV